MLIIALQLIFHKLTCSYATSANSLFVHLPPSHYIFCIFLFPPYHVNIVLFCQDVVGSKIGRHTPPRSGQQNRLIKSGGFRIFLMIINCSRRVFPRFRSVVVSGLSGGPRSRHGDGIPDDHMGLLLLFPLTAGRPDVRAAIRSGSHSPPGALSGRGPKSPFPDTGSPSRRRAPKRYP